MSLPVPAPLDRLLALVTVAALLVATLLSGATNAVAAGSRGIGGACRSLANVFADDDGNVHEAAINCLAALNITKGTGSGYEPGGTVTRGQMASFIARTLTTAGYTFPKGAATPFIDVAGNTHEANIGLLAAAGVVSGYADGSYRPGDVVRRDQMASFINRAIGVLVGRPLAGLDSFADDNGNTHEANINGLAAVGVVTGFTNGTYGPGEVVRRDQMASFIARSADYLVEQGRWGSAVPPVTPPPAGDRERIDLRVLLIGHDGVDEPTFDAWTSALTSIGVPFDSDLATDGDRISDNDLFSGKHARYQGVIVSTDGAWAALTDAERDAVDALQARFGIRKITAYVWPTAGYGFSGTPVGGDNIPEAKLTAAGREVFPYLAGPVAIEPWVWGAQGATGLAGMETLVEGADGSTLFGAFRDSSGREQLVSTVDMNAHSINARLLTDGMLRWLTKGVHLGYSRNYLALHIDDALLADDRWNSNTNTTPEDGANPIRMEAADVDRAKRWSEETGIRLDMVFNGFGVEEYGADDPLNRALLADKDAFGWINHTYTHLNLDRESQATIVGEVNDNVDWANSVDLPYDSKELVTGQHSGLDNSNMPAALGDTPVRWIASDNSRETTQRRIGPALTVPRHPANIYYNVGTFEEQLDEYNFVYYDGCEPIPGVHTCLTEPATWGQYVDSEATIMLGHMLGNDPRPHYMHQSNLAEDGTLYPIVDEALERYNRLFTTDLVQPTLSESGELLRDHAAWTRAVSAGAVAAYLEDGKVHVHTSTAVRVPITGTTTGSTYGGARSGWASVNGARSFDVTAMATTLRTVAAVDTPLRPTVAPAPLPVSMPPVGLAPATPLERH